MQQSIHPHHPPEEEAPADERTILSAFERLHQRLRRMAAYVTGTNDDADDALQDAFIKLWTKRSQIHSPEEAAALATTCVKNMSIDVVRRRNARAETDFELTNEPSEGPPDPSNEIEERFAEVKALISSRLSRVQQQILRLHDYEGTSYTDIASQLHMQEPAVRMQLSRARKAIRDAYRENH